MVRTPSTLRYQVTNLSAVPYRVVAPEVSFADDE